MKSFGRRFGKVAKIGLLGIMLGMYFVACSSKTIDKHSSEFPDDKAKVAFLKTYIKMYSDIESAEFYIVYRDNTAGVPGPSDWSMEVVMKMSRDKVSLWTAGLQPAKEEVDLSWGYNLVPADRKWAIQSKPSLFIRGHSVVAVFEPEGIVFKRIRSALEPSAVSH